MDDDSTASKVKDTAKDKMDSAGGYASRHPRRMWTGAFLVGLGAGMMATKMKQDNRSNIEKLIDHFSD